MKSNLVTRCRTAEVNEAIHFVIVNLIAEFEGTGPETVAPLTQSIDPDVLDRLFDPESAPGYPELAFDHHGYHIYVNHDRHVVVQKLE